MSESIELFTDILDALKSLAESVGFLFSGLTFGLIPAVRDIEDENDNLKFAIIIGRASQSLYTFYLIMILIFAMYFDFNSVLNIIITTTALLISIWFIYLIKKKQKDEDVEEVEVEAEVEAEVEVMVEVGFVSNNMVVENSVEEVGVVEVEEDAQGISGFSMLLYYFSTLILCVRLILNSYFVIKKMLSEDYSSQYTFEIISLSFDFFFLLVFTLTLYLPLIIKKDEKEEGMGILTVWAMEYGDIIAHSTVCFLYATSISSPSSSNSDPSSFVDANSHPFGDVYLLVYFVIYCVNVCVFCLPLPFISNYSTTYHPMIIHTMLLDFITDLPFTVVTLAGKTYVGNFFITIDVVINIVTFIRGIIWVPVKFKTKELDAKKIGMNVLGGTGVALGGLVVFSLCVTILFGSGIWLLYFAFNTSNDCHVGTDVNVEWSIWFHITGWAWFVAAMDFGGICLVKIQDSWDPDEGIAIPMIICLWVLEVFYFIMGAIGCAMWDQTSVDCQGTIEGYTVLVFGIIFTAGSPIAFGLCTWFSFTKWVILSNAHAAVQESHQTSTQ
eukprot:168122_1